MPPTPHDIVKEAADQVENIPLWLVIALALGSGLSGEMLRASTMTDMTLKQIAGRILMRFSAGMLVGLAGFMVAFAWGVHPYIAAAACICIAMLGGDVASTLIERYARKRIGSVE